jgi:hypothetical protein
MRVKNCRMTQSGMADDEAVARAREQLLSSHRLSRSDLVAAYRVMRTATPGAYTEEFIEALISLGYPSGDGQEGGLAVWAEAVEVAREAAKADPRHAKLLVDALGPYQRSLADAGRRADALEACREMAQAGKRAYEADVVASPSHGSRNLACMLAENGEHAAAAARYGAMVRDNERAGGAGKDFWTKIAWIAETEAAGDHTAARSALRVLIDQDRAHAEQETGRYAFVVWELLLLAAMNRDHGQEQDAESCDATTEELLTLLASSGEPKNWSNILGFWTVLAGLTGRTQDRPAPGEQEPPLFADLDWSPDVSRAYLGPGRDHLQAEAVWLTELAEREPEAHLSRLVEVQRAFTLRSVRYWEKRSWRITNELRQCFDEGVRLCRRLIDVNQQAGRSALARALADRTGMHVAARDFPPAHRDFIEARRLSQADRRA